MRSFHGDISFTAIQNRKILFTFPEVPFSQSNKLYFLNSREHIQKIEFIFYEYSCVGVILRSNIRRI